MKKILACAMSVLLLVAASWANDKEKDQDRLRNAGTVLTEILNIPDDIPQDLLDKWLGDLLPCLRDQVSTLREQA